MQQSPPISSGTTAPTAIAHYENFPVASILCPPHLRAPIAAIYHFARTADDIADEGALPAPERLGQLQAYRQALDALYAANDEAAKPSVSPQVFGPLRQAIATHQLPQSLLQDLLDAFVQDVEMTRDGATYADDAQLVDYCRRSANPIGRLLLHLYGVDDPQALVESDAICTALQLINFWQDLSRDIPNGRYYLTDADRAKFGMSQTDVLAQNQTPSATLLIAACAHSARVTMLKGAPLAHRLPGRAGWELRLVVQGGLRILDKIEGMGFATLNARPKLQWWDYSVMVWRALWM
jgi:squalene synthase HpnC